MVTGMRVPRTSIARDPEWPGVTSAMAMGWPSVGDSAPDVTTPTSDEPGGERTPVRVAGPDRLVQGHDREHGERGALLGQAPPGHLADDGLGAGPHVLAVGDVWVGARVGVDDVRGEQVTAGDVAEAVDEPGQVAGGRKRGDTANLDVGRVGGRQDAGPQRGVATLAVPPYDD